MVGLDTTGQIIIQSRSTSGIYSAVSAFHMNPLNQWMHITMTYSTQNGIQLYINGSRWAQNGKVTEYAGSGQMNTITIGTCDESYSCHRADSRISSIQLKAKIDELKVFARELSINEVCQRATGASCSEWVSMGDAIQ
jgi:hypothetical protein